VLSIKAESLNTENPVAEDSTTEVQPTEAERSKVSLGDDAMPELVMSPVASITALRNTCRTPATVIEAFASTVPERLNTEKKVPETAIATATSTAVERECSMTLAAPIISTKPTAVGLPADNVNDADAVDPDALKT
jgi:hypothetical protein